MSKIMPVQWSEMVEKDRLEKALQALSRTTLHLHKILERADVPPDELMKEAFAHGVSVLKAEGQNVDYANKKEEEPKYEIRYRGVNSGNAMFTFEGTDKEWNGFLETVGTLTVISREEIF